ncbi:hypothetical protein [Paracoccus marinaquae]|uniref:hypothetical protein n=1 Tax=Paracoccus marinaquae TaxID=2841926 RepID=UPI0020900E63|nr:hypothetical protein [Paracoccus marinaquae]
MPSTSKIQTLRHAHARRMAGSSRKWQEGVGVALTLKAELMLAFAAPEESYRPSSAADVIGRFRDDRGV